MAMKNKKFFLSLKKQVRARLPLVAGLGGNDTGEILEGFKKFNLGGYEAILSVSPYYNRPNQEGIYQHYKVLDKHTPLPIIMYNVPSRTGQNVTAETQLRIAKDCRNIFATKEASGNLEQIGQIIKNKPDDFMVISGDDGITLPMISIGAEGLISVVANAFPLEYSNMVRYALKGELETGTNLHHNFSEIITSLFAEGSPSGIKAYLSEMGLCKNEFRLPVWKVSDKHLANIKGLLKSIGKLQNA